MTEAEQRAEMRPDGIIVVRMRGQVDDVAFHHFCDELEELYKPLMQPFAIVIDVSMLDFISASRRKRLADMDKKYSEKDKAFNRGQAFVVRNAAIRGALTALHWMARPVYAVTIVDTFDKGLAWAQTQLASDQAKRHAS